jgi:hypothetical protein
MDPNCRSVSPLCQVPNVQFLRAKSGQKGRVQRDAHLPADQGTISVAVIERPSGWTRFEFDLWRSNWILRPEVCLWLRQIWETNLAGSESRVGNHRFQAHFGKNYSRFDVRTGHSKGWENLLIAILSLDGILDFIS